MGNRYVVYAKVGELGLDLAPMPYQSERQALIEAGKLLDEYQGKALIEILLNDIPPSLWGPDRIKKWDRENRPLPPEEVN